MKTTNLRWILTLMLAVVLFESCNTDDDQISIDPNVPVVSDETSQLMVEWNDLCASLKCLIILSFFM